MQIKFLSTIVLVLLTISCKHRVTEGEKQHIAELTVKHQFDPLNHKKLSDFHFREFQANSDGSGYNIIVLNDYMPAAERYKHFSPQTEVFLNTDCTKITVMTTE